MDIVKYLGIPFQFNRASFDSCDCAGLVLLFLKHEFNIDLGLDISDIKTERAKHTVFEQYITFLLNDNRLIRTSLPLKKNCVCLFFNKQNDIYTHCGVVVGGRALHAIEGRATALTPLVHVMDKEIELYEIIHD